MPHAEDCRCPVCHHKRAGQPSAQMTVRLSPDTKKRILSHTKGARAYLEELVKEEPALKGKLQTAKILHLQERSAHTLLKDAHQTLKARYEKAHQQNQIYLQALRRLAEMRYGDLSQIAAQALADGAAADS